MVKGEEKKNKIYVVRSDHPKPSDEDQFIDYSGFFMSWNVKQKLNQLATFEGTCCNINDGANPNGSGTKLDDIKKGNYIYVMSGTTLVGKFKIKKPVYSEDFTVKITGIQSTGSGENKTLYDTNTPQITYQNQSLSQVFFGATDPLGICMDASGNEYISQGTLDSPTDIISLTVDYTNRIKALRNAAGIARREWIITHGSNGAVPYQEGDKLDVVSRVGTDLGDDNRYVFTLSGTGKNASLSSGTEEEDTFANHIIIKGRDVSGRQMETEAYDATSSKTTTSRVLDGWLASDVSTGSKRMDLKSGHGFDIFAPTDVISVRIGGEVIECKVLGDQLIECTRGAGLGNDIVSTTPAAHRAGSDVMLVRDPNVSAGALSLIRVYVTDIGVMPLSGSFFVGSERFAITGTGSDGYGDYMRASRITEVLGDWGKGYAHSDGIVAFNAIYTPESADPETDSSILTNGLKSKNVTDNSALNKDMLDKKAQYMLDSKEEPIKRISLQPTNPIDIWEDIGLGDSVDLSNTDTINIVSGEYRVVEFEYSWPPAKLILYLNDPSVRSFTTGSYDFIENYDEASEESRLDPSRSAEEQKEALAELAGDLFGNVISGKITDLFVDPSAYFGGSAPVMSEWQATSNPAVKDLVSATNISTKYIFECLIAGTTGATEPVWNQTLNGLTVDGTVTWVTVENHENDAPNINWVKDWVANAGGGGGTCQWTESGTNIYPTNDRDIVPKSGGSNSDIGLESRRWEKLYVDEIRAGGAFGEETLSVEEYPGEPTMGLVSLYRGPLHFFADNPEWEIQWYTSGFPGDVGATYVGFRVDYESGLYRIKYKDDTTSDVWTDLGGASSSLWEEVGGEIRPITVATNVVPNPSGLIFGDLGTGLNPWNSLYVDSGVYVGIYFSIIESAGPMLDIIHNATTVASFSDSVGIGTYMFSVYDASVPVYVGSLESDGTTTGLLLRGHNFGNNCTLYFQDDTTAKISLADLKTTQYWEDDSGCLSTVSSYNLIPFAFGDDLGRSGGTTWNDLYIMGKVDFGNGIFSIDLGGGTELEFYDGANLICEMSNFYISMKHIVIRDSAWDYFGEIYDYSGGMIIHANNAGSTAQLYFQDDLVGPVTLSSLISGASGTWTAGTEVHGVDTYNWVKPNDGRAVWIPGSGSHTDNILLVGQYGGGWDEYNFRVGQNWVGIYNGPLSMSNNYGIVDIAYGSTNGLQLDTSSNPNAWKIFGDTNELHIKNEFTTTSVRFFEHIILDGTGPSKDLEFGDSTARIYRDVNDLFVSATGDIAVSGCTSFRPNSDNLIDLGLSSYRWNDGWINRVRTNYVTAISGTTLRIEGASGQDLDIDSYEDINIDANDKIDITSDTVEVECETFDVIADMSNLNHHILLSAEWLGIQAASVGLDDEGVLINASGSRNITINSLDTSTIQIDSAAELGLTGSPIVSYSDFRPGGDMTLSFGDSTHRWNDMWTVELNVFQLYSYDNDIEINANRHIWLNADDEIYLDADENIYLDADENIYLDAGDDVWLRPNDDVWFDNTSTSGRLMPYNECTNDLGASNRAWDDIFYDSDYPSSCDVAELQFVADGVEEGDIVELSDWDSPDERNLFEKEVEESDRRNRMNPHKSSMRYVGLQGKWKKASARSTKCPSVISLNPGSCMGSSVNREEFKNSGKMKFVALSGSVPLVYIEGEFEAGDILISAGNGHAMVDNDASWNQAIGYAKRSGGNERCEIWVR